MIALFGETRFIATVIWQKVFSKNSAGQAAEARSRALPLRSSASLTRMVGFGEPITIHHHRLPLGRSTLRSIMGRYE